MPGTFQRTHHIPTKHPASCPPRRRRRRARTPSNITASTFPVLAGAHPSRATRERETSTPLWRHRTFSPGADACARAPTKPHHSHSPTPGRHQPPLLAAPSVFIASRRASTHTNTHTRANNCVPFAVAAAAAATAVNRAIMSAHKDGECMYMCTACMHWARRKCCARDVARCWLNVSWHNVCSPACLLRSRGVRPTAIDYANTCAGVSCSSSSSRVGNVFSVAV